MFLSDTHIVTIRLAIVKVLLNLQYCKLHFMKTTVYNVNFSQPTMIKSAFSDHLFIEIVLNTCQNTYHRSLERHLVIAYLFKYS